MCYRYITAADVNEAGSSLYKTKGQWGYTLLMDDALGEYRSCQLELTRWCKCTMMTNALWFVRSNSDRSHNPRPFLSSISKPARLEMTRGTHTRHFPTCRSPSGVTNVMPIYSASDKTRDGVTLTGCASVKLTFEKTNRQQGWHFDNLFPSSCASNKVLFLFNPCTGDAAMLESPQCLL